ncbi:hypothetical protein Tco_1072744 [Tanacetum coccineum]
MAKKMRLLTDEVLNSLSAPTYCRALDTTTLRELFDFEGRLIPEDPTPRVLHVAIPMLLFVRERLRGWPTCSHITGTGIMLCLSIWLEFTMFHYRELMTHLVMISSSISSNRVLRSSVEMTRGKRKDAYKVMIKDYI